MLTVLIWILVWMVSFGLVTYFSAKMLLRTREKFEREISQKMQAMLLITESGQVPRAWLQPYVKRVDALMQEPDNANAIYRTRQEAEKACLKKLDDLIRFFEQTNIHDEGEARETILSELQTERRRWENWVWDDFLRHMALE